MKGFIMFIVLALAGVQAVAKDRICCDEEIPKGTRITSANGKYFLIFQEDRNLVLYKTANGKDHPLWATATNGHANRTVMQRDGNLVVYNYTIAVWASHTNGNVNATLIVQDDGDMVITDGQKVLWHTKTTQPSEPAPVIAPATAPQLPPATDRICCDAELPIGARLFSANGIYYLIFQEDRNLVLYKRTMSKDQPIWSSSTNGRVNHCFMQADGNFVLYNERTPVWATGTYGHPNATLLIQSDGDMVITDGQKILWHTNTVQPSEPTVSASPAEAPPPPNDLICCDTEIPIGTRLTSANGIYFFIFQEDRNLVLYKKTSEGDFPIWASATNGRVNRCVMQADGNFVLYKDRTPIWASGTSGHPNATLMVQNDGDVAISDGRKILWHTNTIQSTEQRPIVVSAPTPPPAPLSNRLCCDAELAMDARLTSPNGRYSFTFFEDRSLVVFMKWRGEEKLLWQSVPNGSGNRCVMQADGNLVIYQDNDPVWASQTYGHKNAELVMQDDGNAVIYADGVAVWATNTAQPTEHREEPRTREPQPVVTAPVVNTPCVLPEDQYQRAVAAIEAQPFRDNKMATAKQAIKNKCLSLTQIRGLAKLFGFEDQTLEFVEYAYDYTSEKSEYYSLADLFAFDTNVSSFNKFLNTK